MAEHKACPCSTGAEKAPALQFTYAGHMHCVVPEMPGGGALTIDAPKASGGPGGGPCPVDLLGYAHAACVAMVMGMVARKNGLDLTGMRVHTEVTLTDEQPKRVAAICARFVLPRPVSEAQLAMLKGAAGLCPVHNSLRPEVKVTVDVQLQT